MRVERSQNVNFRANLAGETGLLKASRNALQRGLGDEYTLTVAQPSGGNGAMITISKLIGTGLKKLGVQTVDSTTLNSHPNKVVALVQRSAGITK